MMMKGRIDMGLSGTLEGPEIQEWIIEPLRRLAGETVVVKYGGAAMVDDELKHSFAREIGLMKECGIDVVVVHGGGPAVTRIASALGIETRFVAGQRYTDSEMIQVVQMVLAGGINKEITGMLTHYGVRSLGLCGIDNGLLRTRRLSPDGVDLGQVGEVVAVNVPFIHALVASGLTPVIAPLGIDVCGEVHNVNADVAAAAVAAELGAAKLVCLSDIAGVIENGSVLPHLTRSDAASLIRRGVASNGMIPKLQSALDALDAGVSAVHIVDGRRSGAVLEAIAVASSGTLLTGDPKTACRKPASSSRHPERDSKDRDRSPGARMVAVQAGMAAGL
jgi:acetylglutamate kinase